MDKIEPPVTLEKSENVVSAQFILDLGPEEPEDYTEVNISRDLINQASRKAIKLYSFTD